MEILYRNNHVVVKCHPSENGKLVKAGFGYNRKQKIYATPFYPVAKKLLGEDTDAVQALYKEERETYEASQALRSDIVIPCNPGLEFRPYQKAGIEFMSRRSSTLLADEMGIGKTIQCIGLINYDKSIKDVLVICPAGMKLVWEAELKKWLTRAFNIEIVGGKSNDMTANILIINYDILKKNRDGKVRSRNWDLVIIDEGHYLKNNKSQRTVEVCGGRTPFEKTFKILSPLKAKKRVMLTGTPIPNKPIEIFTLIKYLLPYGFVDKMKFAKKFCDLKIYMGRWDYSGASNTEKLQVILRRSIMIRRLKKDVLKDLPPKTRQIIEINPTDREAMKLLKEEKEYLEDNPLESEKDFRKLIKSLTVGRIPGYGADPIATIRQKMGVLKIPYMIKHIEDCLESSKKIVCFIHHKEVAQKLKEHFGEEAVLVVGATSAKAKFQAVKDFQEGSKIKLFIGNLVAAGVGITLTASSHVIFCESDWVPGVVTQCEDRTHRIGQTSNVLVQHLVFRGGLDAVMLKRVVSKQEIIDKALNIDPEITELLS